METTNDETSIDFLNSQGPSKWECELFGVGRSLVFTPKLGDEPNWFWRKMQFLFFGNKWRRKE